MRTIPVLVFVFCCSISLFGDPDTFTDLGKEILAETWRFHPVHATYKGIHDHDSLLGDYSASGLGDRAKRIKHWLAILDSVDQGELSIDDRMDYQLLRIHLEYQVFRLEELHSYEKDPLIYVGECIDGIYALMLRSSPSESLRIHCIRSRLRSIPSFIEVAKINLRHPPLIFCEIGVEQLEEAEDLIDEIYASCKDSLSENERRSFLVEKNKAIASLWVFADWLREHADPEASPVLGREQYEYKLREVHLLDMDADSLLRLGQNVLKETVELIDSLEGFRTAAAAETVDVPEGFSKDHVMAYRAEEIEFMRSYVSTNDIVTVPDWMGPLQVIETPGFLRTIIPGIAMMPPGPFDEAQTSYFFVRPLPTVFSVAQAEYYLNYVRNRWFMGSVVHEGYPGHHLQLSIANKHPSDVRKSYHDYFLIEGWALYCEELMSRSGVYKDSLDAILAALYGVKFRAARVIVDCMLQTEQWTYEEAVDYMRETVGGDSTFLAKEVRRYLTDPAQASSYLVGKLQILDLRDRYKETMAGGFDIKEFHDRLLAEGSIPVSLIRMKLLDELIQKDR